MPKPFHINQDDTSVLEAYLRGLNWLEAGERFIKVEKAGEGNMNLVLRVITSERSFIIKQSRPWVEKYPQIKAPQGRVLMEAKYYELIQSHSYLQSLSPRLLEKDEPNFALCFEDLGASSDFLSLYKDEFSIHQGELVALVRYLSELHRSVNSQTTSEIITNHEMRELNHYHIFVFPFEQENGFNLDSIQPGLQEIAMPLKNDAEQKEVIAKLGKIYLADGDTLLHGDFYPGSWLRISTGIKVIDPEFCFFGLPEFDLGVMLAHLKLANQPKEIMQFVVESYSGKLDKKLLFGFAGVEIMRRLLGVAQLPLPMSIAKKKSLLDDAFGLVMHSEPMILK